MGDRVFEPSVLLSEIAAKAVHFKTDEELFFWLNIMHKLQIQVPLGTW